MQNPYSYLNIDIRVLVVEGSDDEILPGGKFLWLQEVVLAECRVVHLHIFVVMMMLIFIVKEIMIIFCVKNQILHPCNILNLKY